MYLILVLSICCIPIIKRSLATPVKFNALFSSFVIVYVCFLLVFIRVENKL